MAISLSQLRTTSVLAPPRIVLYGVHGIGKSSFAAGIDPVTKKVVPGHDVVFIQTEPGLDALKVQALPLCQTYEQVVESITALYAEEHNHNTVALDSVDWLEGLIWKRVAADANVNNIDDIGYGKGFRAAAQYMGDILEGLDALRETKGMQVILLAHSITKRFDDPLGEPYDRYKLDLHDQCASKIAEWCDILMFTNYQTSIVKADVGFNKKVARGVGGGNRIMHTQERPGWSAKSRWALPETIPLSYPVFEAELAKAMSATA